MKRKSRIIKCPYCHSINVVRKNSTFCLNCGEDLALLIGLEEKKRKRFRSIYKAKEN